MSTPEATALLLTSRILSELKASGVTSSPPWAFAVSLDSYLPSSFLSTASGSGMRTSWLEPSFGSRRSPLVTSAEGGSCSVKSPPLSESYCRLTWASSVPLAGRSMFLAFGALAATLLLPAANDLLDLAWLLGFSGSWWHDKKV